MLLNDVHSRLNATHVGRLERPASADEVQAAVAGARRNGDRVAVAGKRHAMGGQQFAAGGTVIDMTRLDRVLALDAARGLVEVEAGATWPALIDALDRLQTGPGPRWSIVQKQTGADELSLGGALAANIHGRGLALAPLVADIESLRIVGADAMLRTCSRKENPELFALAIGGYGLFGVVTSLTLRLRPRVQVERLVEKVSAGDLAAAFAEKIRGGCLYGDFQFSIDPRSPGFLRDGILACYRPRAGTAPIPADQRRLTERDWLDLLHLAHADPRGAFHRYCAYYLSTSGQAYWSDTHQLGTYVPDYAAITDRRLGSAVPGSLMITEVYVPRDRLADYLARAARELRGGPCPVVYGTVRLIERDHETFLPWAREPYACIVFNLRVEHSAAGVALAQSSFRRLIDLALGCGGSFYLTYHRWATAAQVEAAHPRYRQFLGAKQDLDPTGVFVSDWYRHYAALFREHAAAIYAA
jgi:FAD/FMN-containing dehydrogenase